MPAPALGRLVLGIRLQLLLQLLVRPLDTVLPARADGRVDGADWKPHRDDTEHVDHDFSVAQQHREFVDIAWRLRLDRQWDVEPLQRQLTC